MKLPPESVEFVDNLIDIPALSLEDNVDGRLLRSTDNRRHPSINQPT